MGELRRAFAAVAIPPEIRAYLADQLARTRIPGKVVPPDNWHVTLRFLGSVDAVTYDRFLGALSEADLGGPFGVRLGGLGAFPRESRATVLWVGVDRGTDHLGDLAAVAEEAAQDAGLAPEGRPFHAHLTLSRVRPPEDVRSLVESVGLSGAGWTCEEVTVFESHLGRPHPHYEPLETFRLGG